MLGAPFDSRSVSALAEALFSFYHPPPPPPPEDPPLLLLLLELLDEPLELLEAAAATGAARPATAALHDAPLPAPPERPPPKPVHVPDPELAREPNEPDEVLTPPAWSVDPLSRCADHSSMCWPSPNARIHGNHSSCSDGRFFASSVMKNSRPDASFLRKASAARCCVDSSAPTPANSADNASITTPTMKLFEAGSTPLSAHPHR